MTKTETPEKKTSTRDGDEIGKCIYERKTMLRDDIDKTSMVVANYITLKKEKKRNRTQLHNNLE
jgi:hypothetical protein